MNQQNQKYVVIAGVIVDTLNHTCRFETVIKGY